MPPEEAAPGPENESHEEAKSYDVNFYQEDPPVADDPVENEGPDSPKFGGESDQEPDEKVEETYEITFPEQYHNTSSANTTIQQESVNQDGKVVRFYVSGKKEILFKKGVRKEIFPDGYQIVYFKNQDIKQTMPDGKVIYYFSETETT